MAIHIGLIGGGNITDTHARAARAIPGVEIAAIYGTNPEKLATLCREYGGKQYRDFDAFLAHRPMNLVAIGSPSGLHATHGIAAAQRGLHVLTEKPIDVNTRRADALIEAARRSGVKLGVMFQDRLKPGICQLREWINAGVIGKPLLADARVKWYRPPEYYGQSRWRGTLALDGGGALINQAVHTVDLLLWLLGDVVRVQSRTTTALHKIEAEDTALAILSQAAHSAFFRPLPPPIRDISAGWNSRDRRAPSFSSRILSWRPICAMRHPALARAARPTKIRARGPPW
jgi:predicted dehydrogenase